MLVGDAIKIVVETSELCSNRLSMHSILISFLIEDNPLKDIVSKIPSTRVDTTVSFRLDLIETEVESERFCL